MNNTQNGFEAGTLHFPSLGFPTYLVLSCVLWFTNPNLNAPLMVNVTLTSGVEYSQQYPLASFYKGK